MKVCSISLACLSLAVMVGCGLPAGGPAAVRRPSGPIELSWDPPSVQASLPGSEIALYYVYYRKHGSTGWRLIGQVPASVHPGITLQSSQIGSGAFDFAVSAATLGGSESRLHASSDASADPIGGWYLYLY